MTAAPHKPTSDHRSVASLADEGGYVIVFVLALLAIALGFAAAGIAESLSSSQLTTNDMRVRRAQQASDAGIQAQLYEQSQVDLGSAAYNLNGGLIGLGTFLDCTVPQLNASLQVTGIASVAANTAGVCPPAVDASKNPVLTSTVPLGNHASYQSEMITGQTNFLNGTTISGQNGSAMRELFPKMVSIGAENSNQAGSGTVHSREEAILAPIEPLQAIEGENSVKLCGLSAIGLCAATILNGDVLSRGNLTTPLALTGLNLSGTSLLATLAYGGSYSGGLAIANLKSVSTSSIIQRPAVSISSSKPNCSVAANCTALGGAYTAATDTFSLTSGSVTFQPGDYVFCNFSATGGTVNINPSSSSPVRIFIDSPSSTRCASDGLGSAQGNFNDTAGFSNGLLGTGGLLASSGMQIYVAGDGAYDDNTTVQIGPASASSLLSLTSATYGAIIYAPTSKVTVNVPALLGLSGGIFEGSVIGNDTTVNALTITQDLNIGNFPLYSGINALRPVQYVQCDNSVTTLTQSTTDLNGC